MLYCATGKWKKCSSFPGWISIRVYHNTQQLRCKKFYSRIKIIHLKVMYFKIILLFCHQHSTQYNHMMIFDMPTTLYDDIIIKHSTFNFHITVRIFVYFTLYFCLINSIYLYFLSLKKSFVNLIKAILPSNIFLFWNESIVWRNEVN